MDVIHIREIEILHSSIEGTDTYKVCLQGTKKIYLRGYGQNLEVAKSLPLNVQKFLRLPESALSLSYWYGID